MNNEFVLNGKSYPVWKNKKGYACITVVEGGKEKAYLLHRFVWERANGPVPDGHELHHLDHDRSNWSLSNLMPLDRQTHQDIHRKPRSTVIKNKPGTDHPKKEKTKG